MKKLALMLGSAAAMALSGCNSNTQDQVDNGQMNQPAQDIDALSNDAANDAANAEAEALGTQQQQLEQENAATNADNPVNPADADEQNVSGM
jgi:hypothetical protein